MEDYIMFTTTILFVICALFILGAYAVITEKQRAEDTRRSRGYSRRASESRYTTTSYRLRF